MSKIFASLGFLRFSLLLLALLNTVIAFIYQWLMDKDEPATVFDSALALIPPVMAPLFIVVILFDYMMSRIRASDSEGETRAQFRMIARLELMVIVLTALYWIPFLISLG